MTLYNPPMHLWYTQEEAIPVSLARPSRRTCRVFAISLSVAVCTALGYDSFSLTLSQTVPIPAQRAKNASPHVGSAMAVLATLEQAQVLPPEGTREADRVIQAVIQFQSVFAKGTDRSVQEFMHRAVADTHGEEAASTLERFRTSGWTAELLEALADADQRTSVEDLDRLATGFGQFNLSVNDFRRLMQLVRDSRSALAARGHTFEEVYARHRHAMPGASVH